MLTLELDTYFYLDFLLIRVDYSKQMQERACILNAKTY